MFRPIHIFRAGRHTAMSGATLEFTEAHLKASADAYDPKLHEAPIVVGHPKDNAPAYGWVQRLSFGEAGLKAHPQQLDEQFAEMVRKGRFKKVSASFYSPDSPANPKPGVFYLRHVGFLGAQPPAVKGLQQAEFADSADDVIELEFGEDEDTALWTRFKAWLKSQMKDDPDFSETAGFRAGPANHQEEPDVDSEELKRREEALAAERKKIEEQEAAFAEREQRLKAAEAKARRSDVTEFVEGLAKAGKVLPRDKAGLVEFMAGIDQENVVEFGEGDEKVSKSAAGWFREFLEHLPQAVDFGERGQPDGDDEAVVADGDLPQGWSARPDKVRLRNQALAYAEKHNVSFVQAVQAIERGAK